MSNDDSLFLAPIPDDYEALLADLRGIIEAGRGQATAAVNAALVQTYWYVGRRIVAEDRRNNRSGYGEQLLRRLGATLAGEFGRAFSERSLQTMRQFYLAYENPNALSSELSWTHYRTLMRLPAEQREFYERLVVSNRWSSRQLEHEIGRHLHERVTMPGKPDDLLATLPEARPAALTYAEAFRDPYILDFLGLEGAYSEKDLEAALIANMERFLLEMGAGFMFVGRQKRIVVDGKDYYVDLVLYHRYMRCIVLVDLKIGDFKPDYVGQMQLYLAWHKRYDKAEGEADPIGLILCGGAGQQIVELLLSDPNERIRVAQYLSTSDQQAIKDHLARITTLREQLGDGADISEQDL